MATTAVKRHALGARGIDRIEAPSGGLFYPVYRGHGQDESDLIYMRARYYEPSVGRFISQDPAMDGVSSILVATPTPMVLDQVQVLPLPSHGDDYADGKWESTMTGDEFALP